MNKLLDFFILMTLTGTLWQGPGFSAGKSVEDEEDDASLYMIKIPRAEDINSSSTIRVKIFPHERDYLPHGRDEVQDQFTVRSENPCTVFKAEENQILANGILAKNQHLVKLSAHELHHPVIIDCPENFTLERNSGEARRELSYSGLLYVHPVKKQDRLILEAINVLSLRGYLRGVVPSEVFHHWPMETLKAQAVAARTYAVFHLTRARRFVPNRLWDVDDTVMYQAYTGITHHNENTDSAVFATDGQILMYQGQVIQAFFHADSGGATEEASTMWNAPAPFTIARPEASDIEMNRSHWERSINLKELTVKLQEIGELANNRTIVRIVVPMAGQTTSGRVKTVSMVDQKGEFTVLPGYLFKRAVGGLPSNLFSVEQGTDKSQILIKGLGFGHGVGMSQQGAAALAQQKAWNYRQILEYYYVRTSLCSIDWNSKGLPDCARESLKYSKQVASQGTR